jgi:hypothetical protein
VALIIRTGAPTAPRPREAARHCWNATNESSGMRISWIGCMASIVISVVLSVILTVILNFVI